MARRNVVSLVLGALAAVACIVASAVPALAQGEVSAEELKGRVERIRNLSPEDKSRLKEALRRFRKLPEAERKALRQKARQVGQDRLAGLGHRGGLGTRDVPGLVKKHERMENERKAIFQALDFDRRTAHLPKDERKMLRRHAGRQFHHFFKRKILSPNHSPIPPNFDGWAPAERRARIKEAMRALTTRLISELEPEERAAYRKSSRQEKRRVREGLIAEYRIRMGLEYARNFDNAYFTRYLQTSPQERRKHLEKLNRRARWFEIVRVFDREAGVSKETLRLPRGLHADDWGRLRAHYEDVKDLPAPERRQEVERAIRELHGKAAADDQRKPPRRRKRTPRKKREKTE